MYQKFLQKFKAYLEKQKNLLKMCRICLAGLHFSYLISRLLGLTPFGNVFGQLDPSIESQSILVKVGYDFFCIFDTRGGQRVRAGETVQAIPYEQASNTQFCSKKSSITESSQESLKRYERPDFIPICPDNKNLKPEEVERDGKWFCNVCDNEMVNGPDYEQERLFQNVTPAEAMQICKTNCAESKSCIGFFY